ncbi:MAG TPA: nucleotide-binding protein [Solirubrobacterales bacterium]|nr:nucleotide-binding protein [Solirubrobacterales bacterium]
MENRHLDALRRIAQADEAWSRDGHEPTIFLLGHSGDGREIDHPRWDLSWSVPSEQTIDDLEELGFLRVEPHHDKRRKFDLTMRGREQSKQLREKMGELARTQGADENGDKPPVSPGRDLAVSGGDESIFIVHGHSRKEEIDLFLRNITGRRPTILSDKAGKGRTIIEKFEQESDGTSFAVVLLTSDDVGRSRVAPEGQLSARARQNVILELGYFIGKLGRERVVALYDDGVELPSDYSGVEFISFADDWKTKLIRELRSAGIAIDPAGI